ncbi:MAG: GMC oxidoreductase [Cyanobacteriota bacterium]
MEKNIFDYVIIGSGFGGSVSAMRLSEKGYSVAVLEMGKKYKTGEFAKTNLDLKKYLWFPQLFLHGIQKLTLLKDVFILSGVGVGGGSLVYANTLLEPKDEYYNSIEVKRISENWKEIMSPSYATAKKMLGVSKNIHFSEPDEIIKKIAKEANREHTWHSVDVGVYFGDNDDLEKNNSAKKDPYFDGNGPERTACNFCGSCMVGCNVGAKNTLDKNYLYFAEKNGAKIIPERKVVDIEYKNGMYKISTVISTKYPHQKAETYYSKGVILSAGVLGSLKLLLECKNKNHLQNLPESLGNSLRTNSESLLGTVSYDKNKDWSKGIAITSGFYPTDETHIEVVRYPEGSDFMSYLATLPVDGGNRITKPFKLLAKIIEKPNDFIKTLKKRGWAKRAIILLVMQTMDNKMKVKLNKFGFLTTAKGDKSPPTYNKIANDTAYKIADMTGGLAQSTIFESVFDMSTTAHILGGCIVSDSPKNGVVDIKCEVFNNPNLHVIDGSIIPSNLGVNPSLTITAMAEQAMSHILPKKERKDFSIDINDIKEEKNENDILSDKTVQKIFFLSLIMFLIYFVLKKKK